MAKDNEGRQLPKHVFYERGMYRYHTPAGKKQTIKHLGKRATFEQMEAIAEALNKFRVAPDPRRSKPAFWLSEYLAWAESRDPKLVNRPSWKTRKNTMLAFAQDFNAFGVQELTVSALQPWWDALTYDQQHNRRAAFSRWFQYMLSSGAVKQNPFTLDDNAPRLFERAKPTKKRMPMVIEQFNAIREKAPAHVRIAMDIALVTMWRESDIVSLKFSEHVTATSLRRPNTKSINQRGDSQGDYFEFKFDRYPMLKAAIDEARTLAGFCDFVISAAPAQRKYLGGRQHLHQVTKWKLQKDFAAVRDAVAWPIDKDRQPTTFHEIKGISIDQYLQLNDLESVSKSAGHTRLSVTKGYRAEQKPIYQEVDLEFNSTLIPPIPPEKSK